MWTRDGKRVVFASGTDNAATHDLFWQPADGSGPAEPLLVVPGREVPHAWASDSTLIYTHSRPDPRGVHRDITTARIPFTGKSTPFANSAFHEVNADLSPDGSWLAYSSNENDGRYEVFVRPFPGPGGKIQVSAGGGEEPKWSLDGRHIFYRDATRMMAVEVRREPSFAVVGPPEALFTDNFYRLAGAVQYDVHPDGFVMLQAGGASESFIVVTNWFDELRRRLAPTRHR
jgi:hypothetical protein